MGQDEARTIAGLSGIFSGEPPEISFLLFFPFFSSVCFVRIQHLASRPHSCSQCDPLHDALKDGWDVCDAWAKRRGMTFGPDKSTLLHFSQTRAPITETLNLSGREIKPAEETRFLGVHLDRKLNFGAHRRHLVSKLKTQRFALSKIAAKTWGPSLLRSRDVYLAVIRSCITYAASTFSTPDNTMGGAKGRGKGIVARLEAEQNKCLRIVTGAYKSTPINVLEAEANCMPINLVLAQRAAAFEEKATSEGGKWTESWDRVKRLISNARGRRNLRRPPTLADPMDPWRCWRGERPLRAKVKEEWQAMQSREGVRLRKPRVGLPWQKAKRIWKALTKHEASCLVQIRSGHIGLGKYLATRKVPDAIPWCRCSEELHETAAHIILDCEEVDRDGLPPLRGREDLYKALDDPDLCPQVVKWFLATGRLEEYRLALSLQTQAATE